uniref:uncharacterized protein LOC122579139 n=1 Tax=Erigeron canadensis TaxID=72917 RepID=UPI001CB95A2D|nr:uncharacterized protein LOC122579139 [Erigeron canadensis]
MANAAAEEEENMSISKCESIRLKSLAEQSYISADLKSALKYTKRAHRLCPTLDGLPDMLTTFKILDTAADGTTQWYNILELEPFCNINLIKKQYKKLALVLHPDKNKSVGSEEAFKLVNEAFRVLSDKVLRKEYDVKLRVEMHDEVEGSKEVVALETFWTACEACRLLHQFERKYLGHNLRCPNCKKSFKAVEVGEDGKEVERSSEEEDWNLSRCNSKRKMSSVGDVMKRSEKVEGSGNEVLSKRLRVVNSRVRSSVRVKGKRKVVDDADDEEITLAEMKKFGKNDVDNDDDEEEGDMMTLAEMKKLSKTNVSNDDEEVMTLAEMQKVVKKNVNNVNLKVRFKVKEKDTAPKSGSRSTRSKNRSSEETENRDVDIMTVEDSDFYDFDKLRVEQSFKKGQIWALYDDDDGMPRHYGLINVVVSKSPFEVDMSWLDPQTNTEQELLNLERTGFHISCGRFKVASKTLVGSLNVFSHNVDCERAAREVYRIYPKKGSVWALYSENRERENELVGDRRQYDIVVFLTTYSEVHGLSMGYLEKVNGFKTLFRRREIGCHAIKWLEKHEVRLFSHQIPARKLSREEVPDISGDCWELDPASLPSQVTR